MNKNIIFIALVAMFFTGCHGKPPPLSTHEIWKKNEYTKEQVYEELLKCGYNRSFTMEYDLTTEQIAAAEICMLRNGFRMKSGHRTVCLRGEYSDLPVCKEYIEEFGAQDLSTKGWPYDQSRWETK